MLAVVGVVFLTSATALALGPSPPRFELYWHAPAECLDRDAARNAIEAALGTKTSASGSQAVVRVKIAQTENGRFAADIWMYDPKGSGERSLEGADCPQVAQAVVLIVAFALKADHDAGSATTQTQTEERRDPQIADRTRFSIGVRAAGDIGSLPKPDAGFALVLEARNERLSAEIALSAWLPRASYNGPVPGSGGEFALYTGALRGCFDLLSAQGRAWSLGPCAGAEAGMTSGNGIGFKGHSSAHEPWGAGLFGLSLRYLGALPLALGIRAELGLPVYRPAWQIDNFGTVIFQPSALVGRASLDVSWQFP